jgi:hypothetical protein
MTRAQHYVLAIALALTGFALIIYSIGWAAACGLFFLQWASNAERTADRMP